jgi:hypothetical protein
MMIKAIVRDKIIMPDRIPTDTDLKTLNCYYESFAFKIDSNMELVEKLEYAMNIVEPHTEHMHRDSIELVAL